jgi:integrase
MSGYDEAVGPSTDAVSHSGLLRKLMAVVRVEFRADVLFFDPTDAVFGNGVCQVGGCGRLAYGHGLCQGHRQRWVGQGRPDLHAFAASTDPRWRQQQPNMVCQVDGCGYGSARGGLCFLHAQRWERGGRPELAAWLAEPPAVKQPPKSAICHIVHCGLWPYAAHPFCYSHYRTWRANGYPDIDAFARGFAEPAVTADESIRLGRLAPQLRLEVQYALQCRHDERTTKTLPAVVTQVVRILADRSAASLLDVTEQQWRDQIGRSMPNARALVVYARRRVEDLFHAGGWEDEYPRDVWHLRRLGFDGNQVLRFDAIPQPVIRGLAKRWLRWRLATGLGLEVVRRGLRSLTRFARFCDRIGITSLTGIDRLVLERYLADLHAELAGSQRESDQIGQLSSFFHTIRVQRWDDSLPATAMFFTEDHPRRPERLPRALAEQVMAQVEHPDNLDRWNNPAYRLVTLILIRCGLRVNDALRLLPDCVITDHEGAPYLRYLNHKMKREALVPIDEELQALIATQRDQAASMTFLFPRLTKNPDGHAATSSSTYRLALYRWLARCDIRDEHGRPVRFVPHQWRHTLGTRLINRDVPQDVVRRILDHDSAEMTSHYARLQDKTVRRHWEQARKVNVSGDTVTLDPDGPLAEAAWAKQRLSRATQALPNGYCGLPVAKSCPHANSCLACPMFLTTTEFLPQHRQHHQQTLQIISKAEAGGQTRMVEMNRQVADNLEKIITALETDEDEQQVADAS